MNCQEAVQFFDCFGLLSVCFEHLREFESQQGVLGHQVHCRTIFRDSTRHISLLHQSFGERTVVRAELRLEGNGFPVMFDGVVDSSLVIQGLSQAAVGFCMFGIGLEHQLELASGRIEFPDLPELKGAVSCCGSRNSASPNLPIASS
jgi:hypothetical protein